MRRAVISTSLLALVLVGLVATPASATAPVRETSHDVFDIDFGDVCGGFSLLAHVEQTVTLTTRGRSPFAKSSMVVPSLATASACLRTSASSSSCCVRASSVELLVGVGCGGCLSTFGMVSIAFPSTFQTASVPRIAKSNLPAGPIGILNRSSPGPN